MPTCDHCKQQWTYAETLKKSLAIHKRCPYCQKENYLTTESMRKISYFSLLTPILLMIIILLDLSLSWTLPIVFVLAVFIIGTSPFTMELSKEQQPLW